MNAFAKRKEKGEPLASIPAGLGQRGMGGGTWGSCGWCRRQRSSHFVLLSELCRSNRSVLDHIRDSRKFRYLKRSSWKPQETSTLFKLHVANTSFLFTMTSFKTVLTKKRIEMGFSLKVRLNFVSTLESHVWAGALSTVASLLWFQTDWPAAAGPQCGFELRT